MKKLYIPFLTLILFAGIIILERIEFQKLSYQAIAMPAPEPNLPQNREVHDSLTKQAQIGIAAMEYQIHYQETEHALSSPNRQNNLRVTYKDDGFALKPRVDTSSSWHLDYQVAGVFRGNTQVISLSEDPVNEVDENRLLQHFENGFHIEYVNAAEGMRQNFMVDERPVGEGVLRVRLRTVGDLHPVWEDSGSVAMVSAEGAQVYYRDLKVFGASGERVPAWMEVREAVFEDGEWGGGIDLVVEDFGVAYPILVDPVSVTSEQIILGDSTSLFGQVASSAGDVNGDGYGDLIVGAPDFGRGYPYQGAAFLFYGSPSGIDTSNFVSLFYDQMGANLGQSVSSAGDLNGDGFGDVIVGVPFYIGDSGMQGAAFLYFGKPTGIDTVPGIILTSGHANSYFGWDVALAGDVNGDSLSDVLVSAPFDSHGEPNEGLVFLYLGGLCYIGTPLCGGCPTLDGPPPLPDVANLDSTLCTVWLIEKNDSNANFGREVSSGGDVNGDGFSDIIVHAFDGNMGSSTLFFGGPDSILKDTLMPFVNNWIEYGHIAVSAGDVDHDGYGDIGVARWGGTGVLPTGYLLYGSQTGIHMGDISPLSKRAGALSIQTQSDSAFEHGGAHDRTYAADYTVGQVGDFNGDGFGDIIVGHTPLIDTTLNLYGILLYFGNNGRIDSTAAEVLWVGTSSNYLSLEPAGDLNGDGYSDIAIGWGYGHTQYPINVGAVQIFYGHPNPPDSNMSTTRTSNQPNANMGSKIACVGDVNGDGFGDFVAGAPHWNQNDGAIFLYYGNEVGIDSANPIVVLCPFAAGLEFGASLTGAGDLNGDGYADVAVGVPNLNGQQQSHGDGAVIVYYGSETGLDLNGYSLLLSNRDSVAMGVAVAGAGDVNGDGIGELIVGVPYYDNGEEDEGAAFVYWGTGIGVVGSHYDVLESNVAGARMGTSLGAAGDLNGDGLGDFVIGAASNDGTAGYGAFAYFGSTSGIDTSSLIGLSSGHEGWLLGCSLAGLGDVNQDGFDDLAIGVQRYTNGDSSEGAVFVYHGHAGGIDTVPNTIVESNHLLAELGSSIAGADVDSDGYNDLVVGAWRYSDSIQNRGALYVFHGSRVGIEPNPVFVAHSDSSNAQMGLSVASGDVDGDGFADIAAGAPHFHKNQNDEGGVYFYYGNGRHGVAINSMQLQSIDSLPIGPGGVTDSTRRVILNVTGKSFLGRQKGRIVFETKINGAGYSQAGGLVSNSVSSSGRSVFQDLAGADTTRVYLMVSGLQQELDYEWRWRVEYAKAQAITGQVYGPWHYAKNSSSEVPGHGFKIADFCAQELDILGNGFNIQNGSLSPDASNQTDFGFTSVCGDTISRIFQLINTGNANIKIDSMAITGGSGSAFGLVQLGDSTIPSGDTVYLEIGLMATINGLATATISLYSNDCDESPYTFAMQAFVNPDTISPEIDCPRDTIICDTILNWAPAIATDNCGIDTVVCSHVSGQAFPVGRNFVTYQATDFAGNSSNCSFEVLVRPLHSPAISPGLLSSYCFGNTAAIGVLGEYSTYVWSGGSTLPDTSFIVTQTDTLQVTVTDSVGCVATAEIIVGLYPLMNALIDSLNDSIFVTANGNLSYEWYLDSIELYNQLDSVIAPHLPGGYFAIITDANQCRDTTDTLYFQPTCTNEAGYCIVIYPNPVEEVLHVRTLAPIPSSALVHLRVFDIQGRLLLDHSQLGLVDLYDIGVHDITSGSYYLILDIIDNGVELHEWYYFSVRP